MFHYITLGSNDLRRSGTFYDAVMASLGARRTVEREREIAYGIEDGMNLLWLVVPHLGYPATWGNGTMIALGAATRQQVRDFHAAALAAGGRDDGAPGQRYSTNFYSCYVRDPDGNKLSAVCEAAE
jgi:catechol 2,3-dioxygenase-like lactoylglutathione lyase family enzyme